MMDVKLSRRTLFARSAGVAAVMGIASVGLTACATNADGVIRLDTAGFEQNAQSMGQFVTAVFAGLAATGKVPQSKLDLLTAAKDKVLSTISEIANASGGVVSIDISKNWASSLVDEINQFLTIAQPLVASFAPSISQYLLLAQAMLPFLQTFIDMITKSTKAASSRAAALRAGNPYASMPAPTLRALIYKGP